MYKNSQASQIKNLIYNQITFLKFFQIAEQKNLILHIALPLVSICFFGLRRKNYQLVYNKNNAPNMIDNQYREDQELGENQDLQLAIDRQNQFEDQDLKTKIIFAVQQIGKVENFKKDGKQIEAYIKKEHCEQSIKDLVKYIRKDVPENPKVCLILSELNIIESDLIKILVLHVEDKKLSFWLLALMSYLTAKPSEHLFETEKQKLNQALRDYKKTFTKNQGFTYLTFHISDYVKTPVQKRQKAHIQMMQFIIILIRNLLQIRSEQTASDALHSHFLLAMMKEDMMGPLFYLLQNQKGGKGNGSDEFGKSQLMQRIQIPLLEIFYHVFTCFDPVVIYETRKPVNLRQQALKLSSKKPQPARHSRFMPNFSEMNQSGITRIVHTLDKKEQTLVGQRKAPVRVSELKKVKKIERDYIQQSYLQMIDTQDDGTKRAIKQLVFEYAKEFVEVQFQILSKLVFDNIYKETAKVSKQNVMQYLILSSWVLKMTRSKYYKGQMQVKTAQEKGAVEFDFGQVLCIMQTGHFQLIYKLLFRETTREKKKAFDINMFNAAIILFLNYLEVIEDISASFNMSDRKNANALMANMFRHDIARIFKIGFHQIIHEKILKTLILINYKFFKLLLDYSRGKVLVIQTNKMLKGKKKGRKAEQEDDGKDLEGFISEDSDAENQSGSYHEEDDKKQHKKKEKKEKQQKIEDEMRFQQRKFNEKSEFSIVADYQIISKYLVFLKNEQFLQNSRQFNTAIFYYFQRIINLFEGEWLFFQAQTLIVFNEILNSPQFAREYPKQKDVVRKICGSFISLLKKNRLAMVQSLFRYSNIQTKEQILKNYPEEEGGMGNYHQDSINDQFD